MGRYWIERDGVRLAYDRTGDGSPALLLIHGAYSDGSVYARQVEYFGRRHQIVTVDLRGHGDSDRPPSGYSVEGFADDVGFLAVELHLRDCVVIGHSLGGLIAVEVAGRHPDVADAVATLDSPSLIPGWSARYAHPLDEDMESPNFRDALERFLRRGVHPADDQERIKRSLGAIRDIPDHVVRGTWRALDWNPVPALLHCKVPMLYLDHGQPGYDLREVRRLCPQVVSGQTVGAGHWALQDVPEQVNAMLDRFINKRMALAEFAVSFVDRNGAES